MSRPRRKRAIYYAHAMCLYWHPAEDLELDLTHHAFPRCEIINPAEYNDHRDKRRDVLNFCFRLIDKSDGVIFSRLLGRITAGVGAEVNHALSIGKQVFELKDWEFVPLTKPVRFISPTGHPYTLQKVPSTLTAIRAGCPKEGGRNPVSYQPATLRQFENTLLNSKP